jgi:uncharacterized protein (DUF58 family)
VKRPTFLNKIIRKRYPQHGQIYIFLNREGLYFVLLALFVLTVAIVYNNNLCYMIVFSMGGIFFASLFFTHFNLKGVGISEDKTHSGFSGDQARISFNLQNATQEEKHNFKIYLPGLTVRPVTVYGALSAQGRTSVEVEFPLPRRGVYQIKQIRLSAEYPFGLFRAWTWLPVAVKYFAYPAPTGQRKLFSSLVSHQIFGEGLDENGDDFSGHKRYERGDSLRHMDWRALARGEETWTKVFHEGGDIKYLFSWRDLANIPDPEQKLSQLSLWIVMARELNVAYEVHLPGRELNEKNGHLQSEDYLKALAEYQHEGP